LFQFEDSVALHETRLEHEALVDDINAKKGKKTPSKRPVTKDIREAFGWDRKPKKYPTGSQQQLRWDMEIMKLLAACNLPYSLVDHPGFKEFVQFADPKVTVKSSGTFRRRKCQLLHKSVKKAVDDVLEKDLPEVNGVAFTTDGWTSRQNDPFQSLTLHYVSKNFELKRCLCVVSNNICTLFARNFFSAKFNLHVT
jgi:hypothetical protein